MRPALFSAFPGVLLMSSSVLFAGSASAQEGLYVGGSAGLAYFFDQELDAGISNIDLKYDTPGFTLSGFVGFRPQTNIRLEVEAEYARAEGEYVENFLDQIIEADYEIETYRLTGNVLLELWPIGSVVPYVGGGAGYAYVISDTKDLFLVATGEEIESNPQHVFTAHAEFGVPFALTPEFEIVPSIRGTYAATEDELDDNDGIYADNLFSVSLRTAVRYNF